MRHAWTPAPATAADPVSVTPDAASRAASYLVGTGHRPRPAPTPADTPAGHGPRAKRTLRRRDLRRATSRTRRLARHHRRQRASRFGGVGHASASGLDAGRRPRQRHLPLPAHRRLPARAGHAGLRPLLPQQRRPAAPPADWTTPRRSTSPAPPPTRSAPTPPADGTRRSPPSAGGTVGRDWINGRRYLEVRFRATSGYAIDPTSINGDELRLVGPGGARDRPRRAGPGRHHRHLALLLHRQPSPSGTYTLTFVGRHLPRHQRHRQPGRDRDASRVAAPTSGARRPDQRPDRLEPVDFNSRGWVDVTFAGAEARVVLDRPGRVHPHHGAGGDTIVLVGTPVRLGSTDNYRYFFVGYTRRPDARPSSGRHSWTDAAARR